MKMISEKIKIALNEEKRDYKANGRHHGGLGSFNIRIQQPGSEGGKIPEILKDESDPNAIKSNNAEILLKLWMMLDFDEKEDFKSFLLSELRKDSHYNDVAYLIFYVLSQIICSLGNALICPNFAEP